MEEKPEYKYLMVCERYSKKEIGLIVARVNVTYMPRSIWEPLWNKLIKVYGSGYLCYFEVREHSFFTFLKGRFTHEVIFHTTDTEFEISARVLNHVRNS